MKIKGQIKFQSLGMGTWTLIGDDGNTYELYQPPQEIQKDGIKVAIAGKVKDDIMTIAMVGKVLAIDSFETL